VIELDPRYCDVIIRRWQEFQRAEAKLDSDGRSYSAVGRRTKRQWQREAGRCRAEIGSREGAASRRAPDVEGLCMALADWSAELRILEAEANTAAGSCELGDWRRSRVARPQRGRGNPPMGGYSTITFLDPNHDFSASATRPSGNTLNGPKGVYGEQSGEISQKPTLPRPYRRQAPIVIVWGIGHKSLKRLITRERWKRHLTERTRSQARARAEFADYKRRRNVELAYVARPQKFRKTSSVEAPRVFSMVQNPTG